MNTLFLQDLKSYLELSYDYVVEDIQSHILSHLEGCEDNFPMICFEYTEDSDFEVSTDESKFLNDISHKGTWLFCGDDDDWYIIVNLKEVKGGILEIDTIEVNTKFRGDGIGSNVVNIIESVAENYYRQIIVSPFDTNAMNFWEYMEYEEGTNGYWRKKLN